MLFQGIDFRTFDMSFTFTPYSAKEAEDVKQIKKLIHAYIDKLNRADNTITTVRFENIYKYRKMSLYRLSIIQELNTVFGKYSNYLVKTIVNN
jgi:predicted ATPase